MMLGKLDFQMQNNEIGPLSYTIHKNNLKQIKDLTIKPETVRLPEENIGKKLPDIGRGNDYLHIITKAQATKVKINQWDYIKFKSFCTTKETINRMKRQLTKQGKIFANHLSLRWLISKIYKELIQLNSKKQII